MKTNHQRGFVEKVTRYVGHRRDGSRSRPNSEYVGTITYADGRVERFLTSDGFKFFNDKTKVGDEIIQACSSANVHDVSNGKRGVAKNIRGAKKYVRSRIRFNANAATQRLPRDDDYDGSEPPSKFGPVV